MTSPLKQSTQESREDQLADGIPAGFLLKGDLCAVGHPKVLRVPVPAGYLRVQRPGGWRPGVRVWYKSVPAGRESSPETAHASSALSTQGCLRGTVLSLKAEVTLSVRVDGTLLAAHLLSPLGAGDFPQPTSPLWDLHVSRVTPETQVLVPCRMSDTRSQTSQRRAKGSGQVSPGNC